MHVVNALSDSKLGVFTFVVDDIMVAPQPVSTHCVSCCGLACLGSLDCGLLPPAEEKVSVPLFLCASVSSVCVCVWCVQPCRCTGVSVCVFLRPDLIHIFFYTFFIRQLH